MTKIDARLSKIERALRPRLPPVALIFGLSDRSEADSIVEYEQVNGASAQTPVLIRLRIAGPPAGAPQ